MTTNKPKVVGYIDEQEFSQRVGHAPFLHPTPNRGYTVPLIRLSDYEALQAECSKALRSLEGLKYVAKVVSNYSDVVCGENNQLRVECEKLRKDAKRYRWLRQASHFDTPQHQAYCRAYGHALDEEIDAAMETPDAP